MSGYKLHLDNHHLLAPDQCTCIPIRLEFRGVLASLGRRSSFKMAPSTGSKLFRFFIPVQDLISAELVLIEN